MSTSRAHLLRAGPDFGHLGGRLRHPVGRRGAYPVAGKVVLVTGAARGIGADAARRLHERGARLALVGLEPELLEQRAAELGGDTVFFEADVTDRAALDRAVAGTVERLGGIDVVIANAGVAPMGTIATMPEEDFERTIEVNLLGVWRTVRAALPHVIERKGYVLPIASLAAALHAPLMAPYAASKAAVDAFANALRGEVAHKGVAVGCAYFSFIDTDMVRDGFDNPVGRKAGGPAGGVSPLSAAGTAIADGVERRARWVVAPGWVRAVLLARGIVSPLVDLGVRRRRMVEALELAEQHPEAPGSGPSKAR